MSNEEKLYSFVDHLEELRYRLIVCCLALVIFTVAGYFFSEPVISFLLNPFEQANLIKNNKKITFLADESGNLKLKEPLPDEKEKNNFSNSEIEIIDKNNPQRSFKIGTEYKSKFYYFSPMTPIILQFKASFLIAVLFSLPVIIFQMWRFIVPALTSKEKKASFLIIAAAFMLFPIGAAFAYYILKFALLFLISFSISGLEPRIDVMKYLSFAVTMMIAMGCVFEFPLAAMFLGKLGIINSKRMRNYRKYSIVLIVIFSAVITPSPDPVSMIMVAIPLTFLYEISIYLVRIVEKKKDDEVSELVG